MAVAKIKIRNWEKWQSFRSDRGAPPWIKVHRNLMTNPEWAALSDAEKGQLVSMWIVAAENGGTISGDANMLKKICQLDTAPDIERFQQLGWLEIDGCQVGVKLAPSGSHDDAPERETETEEKREEKASPPKYAFQGRVIKVSWKDMEKWKAAFTHIDVLQELYSLDEYYFKQSVAGKDTGSWFWRTAQSLATANQKRMAEKATEQAYIGSLC